MFSVYVLYNEEADKPYIGQTEDLGKRYDQHTDPTFLFFGRNAYTKRIKGEWKLVYTETYGTREEARKREKALKSSRGRHFIRTTILGR